MIQKDFLLWNVVAATKLWRVMEGVKTWKNLRHFPYGIAPPPPSSIFHVKNTPKGALVGCHLSIFPPCDVRSRPTSFGQTVSNMYVLIILLTL